MEQTVGPIDEIREAVEALVRYATRGCASMACDRARGVWLGNHLNIIGRAAAGASPELRVAHPDIPWDRLSLLADELHGVASMTTDEMQEYVDRELPPTRDALRATR